MLETTKEIQYRTVNKHSGAFYERMINTLLRLLVGFMGCIIDIFIDFKGEEIPQTDKDFSSQDKKEKK